MQKNGVSPTNGVAFSPLIRGNESILVDISLLRRFPASRIDNLEPL